MPRMGIALQGADSRGSRPARGKKNCLAELLLRAVRPVMVVPWKRELDISSPTSQTFEGPVTRRKRRYDYSAEPDS